MNPHRAFRAAVEAGDARTATAAFHPDATLHSPAVFEPYAGRETIGLLLGILLDVFEDFRYTDEFAAPDGARALLFRTRIGERELQGLDVLRFDEDGRITDLTVMIRPQTGLEALIRAVAPRLAAARKPA
jgi:hypothetical protein